MGLRLSKGAVVPYNQINTKMLIKCGPSTNYITRHAFVVSPYLCSSILKRIEGIYSEAEIKALREFLSKPDNFQSTLTPSVFSSGSVKKKKRLKRKCDNELVRFLFKPSVLDSKKGCRSKLSHSTQNHLRTILRTLEASYYKPSLIDRVIQPKLEEAEHLNRQLQRHDRNLFAYDFAMACFKFIMSFFRHRLSAGDLRRQPRGVRSVQGLDRAHKLSLHLAVVLWKHVYGHEFVTSKDKTLLRDALSHPNNVYYTCAFTNRTLHVRYDNEIAEMLKSCNANRGDLSFRMLLFKRNSSSLSPGAKMRIRQINSAMSKIQTHSKLMRDFCRKSTKVLNRLLWTNQFLFVHL